MERVSKRHSDTIPHLIYSRRALREIYDLLSRSGEQLSCQIGDYRIDDAQDFESVDLKSVDSITYALIDRESSLQILSTSKVSLSIGPDEATFTVADDKDVTSLGLCSQVRDVLGRVPRRRGNLFYRIMDWLIYASALAIASWAAIRGDISGMFAAILTGAVLSIALSLLRYKYRQRIIRFSDVPEHNTFWGRKKDDILINVVALLVGAVLSNLDRIPGWVRWLLHRGG